MFFNGLPAPLVYTSANQVAAVVPYGVTLGAAQVSVTFEDGRSAAVPVTVNTSAPGIFTADESGRGQAAAVNQNGTFNGSGFLPYGAGYPAKPGEYISLYATGEGQTSPPGVDGQIAQTPLPQPILPVTVTIGGQTVTPQYAGAAPGYAGLMQVNVQIPAGTPLGNVPVTIQVGQGASQSGVTVAVGGNE